MHPYTIIQVSDSSDFSIYNLPYGVYSERGGERHICTALGDYVVDILALDALGKLAGTGIDGLQNSLISPTLNDFIALGPAAWAALRLRLIAILSNPANENAAWHNEVLRPMLGCEMHLPVKIPNYTDFYSSEYHATNVGAMFRPDNPLMPNWKHLPVAYHGRASSIVVSGHGVHRPSGQTLAAGEEKPSFGPSKMLDYELETAFIVGVPNAIGSPVAVDDAENHIFGMVLLNDWSARDIQAWEYQPLGPFLAKNFCSTISPWVVTMEALMPYRQPMPTHEPALLPYLQGGAHHHQYDICLEVDIEAVDGSDTTVCQTNQKYLYWTMAQQLAHHTATGCNMEVGDLLGSGTISGPTPDSLGCLLETTKRGKNPVMLSNGETRGFLQKGDTVVMRGYAERGGKRVGFGECRGTITG